MAYENGTKVLTIGGSADTGGTWVYHPWTPYSYDVATDTWTAIGAAQPNISGNEQDFRTTLVKTGTGPTDYTAYVYGRGYFWKWDMATDTWTDLSASLSGMSIGRYGCNVHNFNDGTDDIVIFVGGYNNRGIVKTNSIEAYNCTTGVFSVLGELLPTIKNDTYIASYGSLEYFGSDVFDLGDGMGPRLVIAGGSDGLDQQKTINLYYLNKIVNASTSKLLIPKVV